MTQPVMGDIENGVGGETGKRHGMWVIDRGGRVNRAGRGCVKLPLRVTSDRLGLADVLPLWAHKQNSTSKFPQLDVKPM